MAVTIYHNPRCSKSRATLALLEERGVEPRIVRYRATSCVAARPNTGNSGSPTRRFRTRP